MPAYGKFTTLGLPATCIYPGDTVAVWNAETVTTASASMQLCLSEPVDGGDKSCSIEITFSGAPGAFAIDTQTADTDTNSAYTTLGIAAQFTAVNSGNYASFQLPELKCKFIRLVMTTQPGNAVTVTAKITR